MTNTSSAERIPGEPLVYTVDEVAELLRVSKRHVWGLIRTGEIPTVTLGARRVISKATFHAWFEKLSVLTDQA